MMTPNGTLPPATRATSNAPGRRHLTTSASCPGRCAAPWMGENRGWLAWSTLCDLGAGEPVCKLDARAAGKGPGLLP